MKGLRRAVVISSHWLMKSVCVLEHFVKSTVSDLYLLLLLLIIQTLRARVGAATRRLFGTARRCK